MLVEVFVRVCVRYWCHYESSESLDCCSDRGFQLGGDLVCLVEGYVAVHFDL